MRSQPSPLFVFHPDSLHYRFNAEHPFDQTRLTMTQDLLTRVGALRQDQIMVPEAASMEALQLVHRNDYIEAVQQLSLTLPDPDWIIRASTYGLHTEDTPYFEGMHQAAAAIVGGSIAACEAVMQGKADHALHLGGGLHHAFPDKGAGFCIYNDASVAIAHIEKTYQARILYIDTDVHHGDGVQWSFYTEPNVMTYSIHETGKYLFPGTGFVNERGAGEGFGACVNIPMEPYTEDESWIKTFKESIHQVTRTFKPDLIVSQHGCDAHAYDPLSHLHCSMNIYLDMPQIIHELAHTYCDGRWVALGGGGYDIWRVVPRAWSLLWLEMCQHPLIEQLRSDSTLALDPDWVQAWQIASPVDLPSTWLDPVHQWGAMPRREIITEINEKIKTVAMQYYQ